MGTVVSFDIPAWAGGGEDWVLDRAVQWLHWVDATFSPYRDDSDVSRYGRGLVTLAECAPELAQVLDACADVSARSGGYFTITPGGRFDPSGYVKGWAIERAAAMLSAAGSAEHSVNGGGDVQCVGDHGPGQPWRIGIADPLRPGSLALVVAGRDLAGRGFAVATSGVAERGPHIINPHTGRPATGLASITLVGAGLAETDAYATAAFAMGPAARDWVESLDGYEAFAITPVGATWQTSGFRAYLGLESGRAAGKGTQNTPLWQRLLGYVVDEQAVLAQPQAGRELVLLQPAVVHEMTDRHASCRADEVGQHAPVATPPQALGAHHSRSPRAGQGEHLVHRGQEAFGPHVAGVAAQAVDVPGHVRRVRLGLVQPAEPLVPAVADAGVRQPVPYLGPRHVRMAAAGRDRSDVDHHGYTGAAQQADQLLGRSGSVPEGQQHRLASDVFVRVSLILHRSVYSPSRRAAAMRCLLRSRAAPASSGA